LKKRNPNDFILRRTEGLESTRGRAANPLVVDRWIRFAADIIAEKKIKPENIWNMDETGIELNDIKGVTLCRKGPSFTPLPSSCLCCCDRLIRSHFLFFPFHYFHLFPIELSLIFFLSFSSQAESKFPYSQIQKGSTSPCASP
jgi:hypothetical protein